jgi:hypothetical protein
MDVIELGFYGNLTDERGKEKCKCVSKMEADGRETGVKEMMKIKACPDPFSCSKEDACCELLDKLILVSISLSDFLTVFIFPLVPYLSCCYNQSMYASRCKSLGLLPKPYQLPGKFHPRLRCVNVNRSMH